MPAACRAGRSRSSCPVGFALLSVQGISEIIKCDRLADRPPSSASTPTRSRCNDRFPHATIWRPLMFAGLVAVHALWLSGGLLAGAVGLLFGFIGIELGLIQPDFLGNIIYQLESVLGNDLLLAIPFFTLMGAILERCGLAEDLLEGFGQLFGGVRGGLVLCRDPGWRGAWRHHRHGRGLGHRHGADLAADHDASMATMSATPPASLRRLARSPSSFRHRWCW